jgi:hypothetical protein
MGTGRRISQRQRTDDIHGPPGPTDITSSNETIHNPMMIPPPPSNTQPDNIISRASTTITAEDASECSTDWDDDDSQCTTEPTTLFPSQWEDPSIKHSQVTPTENVTPTNYHPTTNLPQSCTKTWTSNASQALKHLELWHQRMGHPSPCTLRNTTRVVEGLQTFPPGDSLFHCPFCDIAKMTKTSSNKKSTRDSFLPGTAFHMYIGFVRGPKNLKDLLGDTHVAPHSTSQLSHGGYSSYLTIVDAASQFIFCFPLKSKSPPLTSLINSA